MGCCNDSRELLQNEENIDSIENYYILINEKLSNLQNRFGYFKKNSTVNTRLDDYDIEETNEDEEKIKTNSFRFFLSYKNCLGKLKQILEEYMVYRKDVNDGKNISNKDKEKFEGKIFELECATVYYNKLQELEKTKDKSKLDKLNKKMMKEIFRESKNWFKYIILFFFNKNYYILLYINNI